MSQDSIGVVTTGRGKLQEWKTTQKQNLSRKSRGTLTVKWAGSRDKIFSPSGRGRTFFLTSLFIELIDLYGRSRTQPNPSPGFGLPNCEQSTVSSTTLSSMPVPISRLRQWFAVAVV